MKVLGLDGKSYTLKIEPSDVDDENRSSFHLKARSLITQIFPLDSILEEITLPGTRLKADFLILLRRIMIEVQGKQHSEFSPHFHKNLGEFYKGKIRDEQKREWCQINKFYYVELDSCDTNSWEQKIRDFYRWKIYE